MTLATAAASEPLAPPQPITATIPQKALRDALNRVARIIPTRSANPGLTLVTLKLEPNRLTLEGTNLDVSMQVSIPADAQAATTIAVPAAPLQQVINNAPGDQTTLKSDGKELQITSGSYKTRLQLADPHSTHTIEFPADLTASVPAETLAKLLDKTRFAAAMADFQAVFRGINLEFNQNRARAVATDGFRLAYYDAPPIDGLDTAALVIAKHTFEVTKAFTEGDVRIGFRDNRLALENDTTKLTVSLMDGTFPDYERVIPSRFLASVTLERKDLSDTLARVALMSEKGANNRVDLHVKNGNLTISGEGQYGNAQEVLEVDQKGEAEELVLAVNAKFLEEAISPVAGKITLNLNQGTVPMTIVDHEDGGFLGMLVPLRTS